MEDMTNNSGNFRAFVKMGTNLVMKLYGIAWKLGEIGNLYIENNPE